MKTTGLMMCYTSGTTGNSKGVLYSHRALVLHSFAEMVADSFAISHQDTFLMLAPMFHAMAGACLIPARWPAPGWFSPDPMWTPESVLNLIVQERATFPAACPPSG